MAHKSSLTHRIAPLLLLIGLLATGLVRPSVGYADLSDPADLVRLVGEAMGKGPVTFCGEPVPLNYPEIRERLEREMLITIWNRPQVLNLLAEYGRLMPHITRLLKENGMPDDLKYMVIAESALKYYAVSPKGATGYWQFMESTGNRFGLSISRDKDERRNLFASTAAAIRYLRSLQDMLHSWTLAAAAYNMGEEGLKAEILLQKTDDYYKLYLPMETQRYVFRIIAAKMILSNPEHYGFPRIKERLGPLPDRIELSCTQPVPLQVIAEAAQTYFKVIKELNPEMRGHYVPVGSHTLLIPGGAAAGFQDRYEKCLDKWLTESKENVYTVKKGDSLSSLAARFKVPLRALIIWNSLSDRKKALVPGQKLIIYANGVGAQANQEKE